MRRTALCVGLNYPSTSAELSGCINDMEDWAAVLEAREYSVTTLMEPSKSRLVDALQTLVADAKRGDRIVFTYSGHGTWIPDLDGDEADARDEALVCADYQNGGILVDDELHEIFGAARWGVRRTIISDSCHSGTVSRALTVLPDGRTCFPRFLPPAEFLHPSQIPAAERAARWHARSAPRKGAILIAGCSDLEFSYDAVFGGRPNGAFSYHAIAALKATGQPSLSRWMRNIRTRLPSVDYPQSPQLTTLPWQKYGSAL